MMFTLLAYIAAIAIAEVVGIFVDPITGVFLHVVIITILLGNFALEAKGPNRRVLPVLLLAPLLRILSFVMPIQEAPRIYWYGLVGAPLLISTVLAVRFLGLSWAKIGLQMHSKPVQMLIGLSGIPLSIAAFIILQPAPLFSEFSWLSILTGSVILVIFTGFTEEFIFRGLLQTVTSEAFGSLAGVLISSIIFTIMYFASMSLSYIFFISLVGLFFSFCVKKSGSIWGVTFAHSFMNIGMIVIWPFVMNGLGTP